jgi:hypothetical protein
LLKKQTPEERKPNGSGRKPSGSSESRNGHGRRRNRPSRSAFKRSATQPLRRRYDSM